MITDERKNELIQRDRYVVMVPKFGDLPPCPTGATRFLMAERGLYLETKAEWGGLCVRLWDTPVPQTQFGHVEEYDDFLPILRDRIYPIVEEHMLEQAAEAAKDGKEWAGWIMHHEGDFFAYSLDYTASAASVSRKLPDAHTWPGRLACDVHSHGMIPAYFSSDDDRDDAFDVRVCIVVGNYQEEENSFDMRLRYIVHGFFFPLISLEKGVMVDGENEALCIEPLC